jgi:hypothetical protein
MSLPETLSVIAADLLSEKRFEPFIRRLFADPPGVWHRVADLCTEMGDLPHGATEVFNLQAEQFQVTYLPWPEAVAGHADCLILFIHDVELWSTIAYFNRAALGELPGRGPASPSR